MVLPTTLSFRIAFFFGAYQFFRGRHGRIELRLLPARFWKVLRVKKCARRRSDKVVFILSFQ